MRTTRIIPFIFFATVFSLILSSYSIGPAHRINWDGTGASGTSGCNETSVCHHLTTSLNTALELDSAGVAVDSYRPGGSYTIKVSAVNNINDTFNSLGLGYFGFQIASVFDSGSGTVSATQAGTWGTVPAHVQNTPDSGTRTFAIIEHRSDVPAVSGTGGIGTVYAMSIPWTAPATGSGPVRLFGVINAASGYGLEYYCFYQVAAPVTITEAAATGINELNAFTVYPALMNDHITLSFDLKKASTVSAALIAMDGRTVETLLSPESIGEGNFKRSFNVGGLATGIYLLMLQAGNESICTKVVKAY